ncbi:MAG: hypothetical protein HW405_825, partial [Candidatus Berkelbacteria bacterium]|nr:hypothetical protein [Candidatus Berkelbacteria bacterium]
PTSGWKTKKLIFSFVGFIFLFSVCANFSYAKADYSAGTLVSMTNSTRTKNGLGALTTNSQLTSAAYAKAQDMLTNQYFAHTSPQGKTPWDFIRGAGYNYDYAGENLAIGYTDSSELFSAWMASATHRENILNSSFREIGIAVVSGTYEGSETIVVAQEFGARADSPQEEVASSQAPEPQNSQTPSNPSTTPAPNSTATKNFQFVRDRSSFSPQTVFVGEEVIFQATVTGDISILEVQVFDQKFNLLETGSVSGDIDKTYSTKQKISHEGDSDVTIVAKDKNGNSNSLILGKLTVNKTLISKNTNEEAPEGMFAGFKASLTNYWYVYTIIGGLLLAGIGYLIFRKIKLGKNLKVRLALWEL